MGDGINKMICICVPVYNGEKTIRETIQSILAQNFKDFECIIVDNASTDQTVNVVKAVSDHRIRLFVNKNNIGCGRNIEECKIRAKADIIVYLAADDILSPNALQKILEAFSLGDNIGVVVRPYYWFTDNVSKPVRATKQFKSAEIVSINDSYEKIALVLALSDQISGMAFRKKYMDSSFGTDYFVEVATMAASVLKVSKAVILKENIVAVRISDNGAMQSYAYKKSPMLCWYDMITGIFHEENFKILVNYLVRGFVAKNFIGLVQIKNFADTKALLREIELLVRLNPLNVFNPAFWFFALGTIAIPRSLLWKIVVYYKARIGSHFLRNIKLGE